MLRLLLHCTFKILNRLALVILRNYILNLKWNLEFSTRNERAFSGGGGGGGGLNDYSKVKNCRFYEICISNSSLHTDISKTTPSQRLVLESNQRLLLGKKVSK